MKAYQSIFAHGGSTSTQHPGNNMKQFEYVPVISELTVVALLAYLC